MTGHFALLHQSDRAGNLARAQATGAGVDVLRRTVYDSLNTLHIGLPGPVGTPVRVGHLNAEGNALATVNAFSHLFYTS